MNVFSTITIQSSAERDHYYNNRLRAEKDPQKCLSVITVDEMDQAKTIYTIFLTLPASQRQVQTSREKISQSLTISRE